MARTLILEDYPEQNLKFLDENGITLIRHGVPGNKEPFVDIPEKEIVAALKNILGKPPPPPFPFTPAATPLPLSLPLPPCYS